MAGDWIKVEKCTPTKPEILEMAGILGLSPDEVFGKCFRIWSWADDHTEDGNARGVTPALVDSTMGVTGFAKALEAVGWLEHLEKPRGGVRFVNFERHNGQTAKKRAVTAKRVAKHKDKSRAISSADTVTSSVTNALPREEKRREEPKGISIPPTLAIDTDFVKAFDMFAAYVGHETGRPLDQIRADVILMKCTERGTKKAAIDLLFSIEKKSTNLLDKDDDFAKHRKVPGPNGAKQPQTQLEKRRMLDPNCEVWDAEGNEIEVSK